jgi:hypothetical protein
LEVKISSYEVGHKHFWKASIARKPEKQCPLNNVKYIFELENE